MPLPSETLPRIKLSNLRERRHGPPARRRLLTLFIVGLLTGSVSASDTNPEKERAAALAEHYIHFSPFSVFWLASEKMAGPGVLSRPVGCDSIALSVAPIAETPPEIDKPGNYRTPGVDYAVRYCSISGRAVGKLLVSRDKAKHQLGVFCDTSNRALANMVPALKHHQRIFDAEKARLEAIYADEIHYIAIMLEAASAFSQDETDAGPRALIPDARDVSGALIMSGRAMFKARQAQFDQDETTKKLCSDTIELAYGGLAQRPASDRRAL